MAGLGDYNPTNDAPQSPAACCLENCKVRCEGDRSMFSADDFAVRFADWPKNGPDPDFAVLLTAPVKCLLR